MEGPWTRTFREKKTPPEFLYLPLCLKLSGLSSWKSCTAFVDVDAVEHILRMLSIEGKHNTFYIMPFQ